jgi:hypothetical protein
MRWNFPAPDKNGVPGSSALRPGSQKQACTSIMLGVAISDPGVVNESFSLNTTGMSPCGYSLTLNVWDRSNVNSGETGNHNPASIGFCLETASSATQDPTPTRRGDEGK